MREDGWWPIRCSATASPARKSFAAPMARSSCGSLRARAPATGCNGRHRALHAGAAALRYAGWRCDAHAARRADALHCDRELPMIRLVFTILAGLFLGGIVHLVSVLALPRIA